MGKPQEVKNLREKIEGIAKADQHRRKVEALRKLLAEWRMRVHYMYRKLKRKRAILYRLRERKGKLDAVLRNVQMRQRYSVSSRTLGKEINKLQPLHRYPHEEEQPAVVGDDGAVIGAEQ